MGGILLSHLVDIIADLKSAKDIFAEIVEELIKKVPTKGYKDEGMVVGFFNEQSPENQANTVSALSFGKPRIRGKMRPRFKLMTCGIAIRTRERSSFTGL
ncbi:MAG: hypothetical protein ACOC6R_01865 [Chloroflexota bacterium]